MNKYERWCLKKLANNTVIDGILNGILTPILKLLQILIEALFSNPIIALILFILLINLIAIILMKKDKAYAQMGERRIRESTLLIVAIVGGSFGMYYAMFKYKHKTLHNKFSMGIPVIIVIQLAYISYLLVSGILS